MTYLHHGCTGQYGVRGTSGASGSHSYVTDGSPAPTSGMNPRRRVPAARPPGGGGLAIVRAPGGGGLAIVHGPGGGGLAIVHGPGGGGVAIGRGPGGGGTARNRRKGTEVGPQCGGGGGREIGEGRVSDEAARGHACRRASFRKLGHYFLPRGLVCVQNL